MYYDLLTKLTVNSGFLNKVETRQRRIPISYWSTFHLTLIDFHGVPI